MLAGLSHCVHGWKASGRSSDLVDFALSAMALAVYSRIWRDSVAAAEACSMYDRLLPLVHEQITHVSTLRQKEIDPTLLAMFLMGRYEGVMHGCALGPQQPIQSIQSWSHHDGVMALLKFWYDNLSQEPATAIVKHTRRGSIRSSLLRGRPLPPWLIDGQRFGEEGLDLEHDRIHVRIVSLRCALAKLFSEDTQPVGEVEGIDTEAQDLDEALQRWASKSLSTYQLHTMTISTPYPTKHFYAPTIYSYNTLGDAAECAQYFATRMILVNTRVKVRSKAIELSRTAGFGALLCDRAQRECTRSLSAMAESLAHTVPFCLQLFEIPQVPGCRPSLKSDASITPWLASLVIWPLSIAASLDHLEHRQQSWFKSELSELGKITGDGVLQDAETDRWLKF